MCELHHAFLADVSGADGFRHKIAFNHEAWKDDEYFERAMAAEVSMLITRLREHRKQELNRVQTQTHQII